MINAKEVSQAWVELTNPQEKCPFKINQMIFSRLDLDDSCGVVLKCEPQAVVKILKTGLRPIKAISLCRVGFHCIPETTEATLIPIDKCNYYTTTDAECLKIGKIEIYSRASENDKGNAIRLASVAEISGQNDAVVGVNNRITIHRSHVGRYIEAWVHYQPYTSYNQKVGNITLFMIVHRSNTFCLQKISGCTVDVSANLPAYDLKLLFNRQAVSDPVPLS